MASVDARVSAWVDVVAELLRRPLTAFPADLVSAHLVAEFDAVFVGLNERDDDGAARVSSAVARDPRPFRGLTLEEGLALAHVLIAESGLLEHHALIRWFAATGEMTATTTARVPPSVGLTARTPELQEVYTFYGIPQQLSMPVSPDLVAYQAFVICRGGDDFSDEDLAVAHRVQGMLTALFAQCEVLATYAQPPPVPPDGLLTARELAVLRLIADGATSGAAGRRLGCSPRTVEKHTQNIYRKLEVRDRVSAVTVARAIGLLQPPHRWTPVADRCP